jgi:uncharacterized protein YceK
VRPLLLALVGAFLLAGCGGETVVTVTTSDTVTETETETETETVTETITQPLLVGLPEPVLRTHTALVEAARAGDYEALRPLIPAEFSYTFGGPVEGGPIAYWRQIEAEGGESPLETLDRILALPYTLFRGTYIWPFAYDKQPGELTSYERRLLGDLGDDFGAGSGYLGWRAGIAPDGTWSFFIAGD